MSEEDEPDLVFYGTPLEPYDEDAFPKRKPISLEDQIATDSHGRRRFHGAFTGGFSAGFFNTVGSLEGWTPSEFKSTRTEKASKLVQNPADFMDDEDIGEYGIAPQTVKATKDYATVKKRSRKNFSDGPIPGEPVLETLMTSGNETVGYLLLRNMGIEDKMRKKEEELNSGSKIYGCEMPAKYQISEDVLEKEYKIPDIYQEYLNNPKVNTAGFGYRGLEKSHVNLFHSTNLVVRDKNDKRFTIGGQAFGVGAFEDEDDDIYVKEDMSNYDFEMTKEKEKPDTSTRASGKKLIFGMFEKSSTPLIPKKQFVPPTIPHWFTGVHKMRKSRFEPVEEQDAESVSRDQINPSIRAKYLGEEVTEAYTPSKTPSKREPESPNVTVDSDRRDNSNGNVKTFDVASVLSDRFVSASKKEDVSDILENVEKSQSTHGTQQMRDAAKMKLFGPLTRITSDWHPCSLLCKRFNVPEPLTDRPNDRNKKRTKNLIFQSQKHEETTSYLKPGISHTSQVSDSTDPLLEPIKIEPEEEDSSVISSSIQNEENLSKENKTEEGTTLELKEKDSSATLIVDFTEKIGIEDKIDLYKAVFLSSSESEDEEDKTAEKTNKANKIEEFKSTILLEPLIPQIKPIKEGILSGIDFRDFNKNRQKTLQDDEVPEIEHSSCQTNPLLYGPQVPVHSNKIENHIPQKIIVSSGSEDEWVEKNAIEKKKKSKHKKKDKKHKKRKKKDKR